MQKKSSIVCVEKTFGGVKDQEEVGQKVKVGKEGTLKYCYQYTIKKFEYSMNSRMVFLHDKNYL